MRIKTVVIAVVAGCAVLAVSTTVQAQPSYRIAAVGNSLPSGCPRSLLNQKGQFFIAVPSRLIGARGVCRVTRVAISAGALPRENLCISARTA
jgi:hypothetical protein